MTTGKASLVYAVVFSLVLASPLFSQRISQELTYNDIWGLSGATDTLWLFAVDQSGNKTGLNYRAGQSDQWTGFFFEKKSVYNFLYSMKYGVAIIGNEDAPSAVWTYSHQTKEIAEYQFTIPEYTLETNLDLAQAGSYFFFTAGKNGLMRLNPENGEIRYFKIGNDTAFLSNQINGGSREEIVGMSSYSDSVNQQLIISTGKRLWIFDVNSGNWDSTKFENTGLHEDAIFYDIAVNELSPSRSVFAYDSTLFFYKYSSAQKEWRKFSNLKVGAVAFGHKGYTYLLDGENNQVQVFEDVDSLSSPKVKVSNIDFRARFGEPYPQKIRDILYLPSSDTGGMLFIGTSDGLYFNENEVPGITDTSKFVHVKRYPSIKKGLDQVYARPGILKESTYSSEIARTIFVYNLSKNAKTTIRVYDYNMDLVKTIIKDEPRKAGSGSGSSGRSTDEARDFWDGKNHLGKKVAPGVYYFKITTDIGERAFGKIIVAK